MDRRTALKKMMGGVAGAAALGLGGPSLLMRPAAAQTGGKTMVFAFQRGGNDGLNMVVPYGDPDYALLRDNLRIPNPTGADPFSAIDLNGFFGFHPAMAPLLPAFQAGDLAILPAVHYSGANQSHFDSQLFVENGTPNKFTEGCLNRHLQTAPSAATFRAVSLGGSVAHSLRGEVSVAALDGLGDFTLNTDLSEVDGCTEFNLLSRVGPVYDEAATPGSPTRALLHDQGSSLFRDLENFAPLAAEDYQPANGAVYPETDFGRHMKTIAQLIKEDVGLEVAAVTANGGWDTHSGQGAHNNIFGRHWRLLDEFANTLAAFYKDLGNKMSDVVVVTGSEFGRTAAENSSGGTDHGFATCWLALGGGLTGGFYGDWPTLSAEQLHNGRYLQYTVDYRDLMGDVISNHLGNASLNTIFPDHTVSPVGLFN